MNWAHLTACERTLSHQSAALGCVCSSIGTERLRVHGACTTCKAGDTPGSDQQDPGMMQRGACGRSTGCTRAISDLTHAAMHGHVFGFEGVLCSHTRAITTHHSRRVSTLSDPLRGGMRVSVHAAKATIERCALNQLFHPEPPTTRATCTRTSMRGHTLKQLTGRSCSWAGAGGVN